jgi:quercetin dioxygenase-like cupin family protein
MDLGIYSLGKNEGPALWFLNTLAVIKASAKQTGNAFGLIYQLAPGGFDSPYHVHRTEDETFYVLDGQLEFISEERRFTGGPGSYVFLPRDIPHGFRVVSTSPAQFLILIAPGGFEAFVTEFGEPASSLTLPTPSEPDMGKLMTLAEKYRIEVLGPLPE